MLVTTAWMCLAIGDGHGMRGYERDEFKPWSSAIPAWADCGNWEVRQPYFGSTSAARVEPADSGAVDTTAVQ